MSKDHYVSRFFLSGFTDPEARTASDPWLWVASLGDGTIKRRAPKNIAWSRDLFAGPGGLADRERCLESFLAEQVEGPAAAALRDFLAAPMSTTHELLPELSRYLAWLAARSLTMKTLYAAWVHALEPLADLEVVEPPPTSLLEAASAPDRCHTMEHPAHGSRSDVRDHEIESLRLAGWTWHLSTQDFLEMVHVQAWYFQIRFLPRLSWKVLEAPEGSFFITCDRPAVWGVNGDWEVPPAALRHPNAEMFIPISRTRALFAFNPEGAPPGPVALQRVNNVMTMAAHTWIGSPTRAGVERALEHRVSSLH